MGRSGGPFNVDQYFAVEQSLCRASSCPVSAKWKKDSLPSLHPCTSLPPAKEQRVLHGTDNKHGKGSSMYTSNQGVENSVHFSVHVTSQRTVPTTVEHESPADMNVQWPGIAGFGIGMATSIFAIFLCFIEGKGPRTTAFRRGLTVGICFSAALFIVFFVVVYIAPIFYRN